MFIIFISWGDHDLTENIIHLVIARVECAPEGVPGISLFVVPKMKVSSGGSIEGSNDVLCGGLEEKLGLHSSPTCILHFGSSDGCTGYLCGEANKGLAHMFQMMNAARINTGVSGMTLASSAYQNALEYVKTYFTDVTLPHTLATADVVLREGREVVEMPEGGF